MEAFRGQCVSMFASVDDPRWPLRLIGLSMCDEARLIFTAPVMTRTHINTQTHSYDLRQNFSISLSLLNAARKASGPPYQPLGSDAAATARGPAAVATLGSAAAAALGFAAASALGSAAAAALGSAAPPSTVASSTFSSATVASTAVAPTAVASVAVATTAAAAATIASAAVITAVASIAVATIAFATTTFTATALAAALATAALATALSAAAFTHHQVRSRLHQRVQGTFRRRPGLVQSDVRFQGRRDAAGDGTRAGARSVAA